jgi:two-component system response regulator PilR (NtrC family)
MSYEFPGNVRELENVLERAVTLAGSSMIGLGDLPEDLSGLAGSTASQIIQLPIEGCKLDEVLTEVERRLLLEALERTGGVRTKAAKLLGISFRSLRYRLEKQNLGDRDEMDVEDAEAG